MVVLVPSVSVNAGKVAEAEITEEVRLAPVVVTASVRGFLISDMAGRISLRSEAGESGAKVRFAKKGAQLVPGETVTTGQKSRLELLGGGEARWRLGGRTAFALREEGARLLAGTALVVVPEKETWTVETFGSQARLGEGMWILHAVENEGLKVICLDGPARLETDVGATAAGVKMKPGELIFLRPGGKGFGPLVTIYLEELLATSRLVRGFEKPLPNLTRLVNLGIAQREQLKGVTGALVAGARGEGGFDVVLPRPKEPAPATGK
ncbi:MAG TPA: hypothetical protein VK985_15065 [Rariglobus sp.]|nr:hypothetical protein [Rariglobus sp.]